MRLSPGRPRTLNEPTGRHTGATCVTVTTTVPPRASRKRTATAPRPPPAPRTSPGRSTCRRVTDDRRVASACTAPAEKSTLVELGGLPVPPDEPTTTLAAVPLDWVS